MKKKLMIRIAAVICLLLTLLPMNALAADDTQPEETGSVEMTVTGLIGMDFPNGITIPLPGVVYDLYRGDLLEPDPEKQEASFRKIGTYTTDEEGVITVTGLPMDLYYFQQMTTPDQFYPNDRRTDFHIAPPHVTYVSSGNILMPATPEKLNGDDHFAYVTGYDDGTVRPQANITRAQVATIFFRLLEDDVRDAHLTRENNFRDVDGAWYATAVSTMADMGIIRGYPSGLFKPDAPITRAEFAAVAARFSIQNKESDATYTDTVDHWAEKDIRIVRYEKWVEGYDAYTFRPDRNITRAQVMTVVNRMLNRIPETKEKSLLEDMTQWTDNADPDQWYYLAVQEATNSHYTEQRPNGYEYWTSLREDRDWTAEFG